MSSEAIRGTLTIPEAERRVGPTDRERLDRAVAEAGAGAKGWVFTDVATRIELLDELIEDTFAVADQWARLACQGKGVPPDSPLSGEEWQGGPVLTLRNLRLLRVALADIRDHGRPRLPGRPTARPDGQVVVPVVPTDRYDRSLFPGFRGEVWMHPDVTAAEVTASQAAIYRRAQRSQPRVALVLGAGNISAIPATDTLHKLFHEDQAVVLKMNPVNEQLGPTLEEAFRALTERDVLRVVYGGGQEGAYLSQHDGVDTIHVTGSDKTHDAIVFGPGEEGRRNKQSRTPVNTRPITSELGGVSPIVVVPGPWSRADLDFQGQNVASMITHNAGFNCIAGRLIVTHQRWNRRGALLDAVRDTLRRAPQRYPYYPGARERWETFVSAHPEAERYGLETDGQVPFTLIPGLDADAEDLCFTTEAFCGVIGEVPLDAPTSVPAFLEQAVEFVNNRVWGTLGATLVVHPRQLSDPAIAEAVDRAVAELRYGTVVVNHWTGLSYGFVSPPWGGYPGHDLYDIQSGRGFVHNTYMLERPQKSVLHGPFRMPVIPPWFVTHRRQHEVWRRGAALQAHPSPAQLAAMLPHVARG